MYVKCRENRSSKHTTANRTLCLNFGLIFLRETREGYLELQNWRSISNEENFRIFPYASLPLSSWSMGKHDGRICFVSLPSVGFLVLCLSGLDKPGVASSKVGDDNLVWPWSAFVLLFIFVKRERYEETLMGPNGNMEGGSLVVMLLP